MLTCAIPMTSHITRDEPLLTYHAYGKFIESTKIRDPQARLICMISALEMLYEVVVPLASCFTREGSDGECPAPPVTKGSAAPLSVSSLKLI